MAWRLDYSRTARKNIERLGPVAQKRIHQLMEQRVAILTNPRDLDKALTGPFAGLSAYRAGDYRVVCRIEDDRLVILIATIGHRGDVYRDSIN